MPTVPIPDPKRFLRTILGKLSMPWRLYQLLRHFLRRLPSLFAHADRHCDKDHHSGDRLTKIFYSAHEVDSELVRRSSRWNPQVSDEEWGIRCMYCACRQWAISIWCNCRPIEQESTYCNTVVPGWFLRNINSYYCARRLSADGSATCMPGWRVN